MEEYVSILPAQDNIKKAKFYADNFECSIDRLINPSDGVENSNITFHMPSTVDKVFTSLSETEVIWKLSLVKGNNEKIELGSNVGLINEFVQTQIESVHVLANGKIVWDSSNYYSELAFINAQTTMSYGDKRTSAQNWGYIEDYGQLAANPTFSKNEGNLNRALMFGTLAASSTENDEIMVGNSPSSQKDDPPAPAEPKVKFTTDSRTFVMKFIGGIFEADNHLPPKTNLEIRINMKPRKWSIFCSDTLKANDYKLKVNSCTLQFKQYRSSQKYWDEYIKNWKENPVKLRYTRMVANSFNLTTTSLAQEHVIKNTGINPKRLLVTFRDEQYVNPANNVNNLYFSTNFEKNGHTETSPSYAFLKDFEIRVGGKVIYDLRDKVSNWQSLCRLHYMQFLDHFFKYGGCSLDMLDFVFGRYIIPYDLTTTQRLNGGSTVRQPVNNEDIRMSAKLSSNPKGQVQVLIFMEYDTSFTIDFNGHVVQNFFD